MNTDELITILQGAHLQLCSTHNLLVTDRPDLPLTSKTSWTTNNSSELRKLDKALMFLSQAPRPQKGSFEDVFGHLGTPEEVAQEWSGLQALKEIVIRWCKPVHIPSELDNLLTELDEWLEQNP